jgi:hypothetical protein
MKNLKSYVPVVILFAYSTLCFFRAPEIADAIIVVALAFLYAVISYIEEFSKPKHIVKTKEVPVEHQKLQQQIDKMRLEKERVALENDLGKMVKLTEDLKRAQTPFQF